MKHYYVLRNRETGKYYGVGDDEECSYTLKNAEVFNNRADARCERMIDKRQRHKYAEDVVKVCIDNKGRPYITIKVMR